MEYAESPESASHVPLPLSNALKQSFHTAPLLAMSHMSPVGGAGTPGGGGGGSVNWTQHVSPDGRPYWNNVKTGQSVWEKPSELKTPAEREIEKTPWKEYETGGRKYWVHSETKETTWEAPAVVKEIMDRFAAQGTPRADSTGHLTPGAALNAQSGALVSAPNAPGISQRYGQGGTGQPISQFMPRDWIPGAPVEFATQAEAQRAFIGMLGEVGVTPDWTWERVMRETITHPLYKAVKVMADRKSAFEKYVDERIKANKEEQQKSLDRCRKDWTKAMDKLGGGPEKPDGIKAWWTWEDSGSRELRKRMSEDTWNAPRNDAERRILFNEFVDALRSKERQRKQGIRDSNMRKVADLFEMLKLDLGGTTRWRDAQRELERMPEWQDDPELQRMDPIDVLTVYEDEVRKAEQASSEARARAAEDRRRKARKAREDFTNLLEELRLAGRIRSGTPWKSIYPYVEDDERYEALLGQPGSTPLDLFWDTVDKLDLQIEADERIIASALREVDFRVTEDTTYDELTKALERDQRIGKLNKEVIETVFEKMIQREKRIAKEERRKAERKLRVLIDDLRYAYKKLEPPVDLESSYEDNVDRVKDTPEFLALEGDDESRRAAFDKFVRRQKEKLRDRDHHEHDRGRDRRDSRRDGDSDDGRHHDRSHRSRRHSYEVSDDESERRRSHHRPRDGSSERYHHKRASSREAGGEGRRSKYPRREASEDVEMRAARNHDDLEEGEI